MTSGTGLGVCITNDFVCADAFRCVKSRTNKRAWTELAGRIAGKLVDQVALLAQEIDATQKSSFSGRQATYTGSSATEASFVTEASRLAAVATHATVSPSAVADDIVATAVPASSTQQPPDVSVADDIVTQVVPAAATQRQPDMWCCSSCYKPDQRMRQCWECTKWACKSCSFWCTTCPKGKDYQYNICGHCAAEEIYLQKDRHCKIWRCTWCSQAR